MATVTNTPAVLSASSILSDEVRNGSDEKVGKIEDLMIDLQGGQVRYAVMSFGGFLGMGDKLFAVPFEAFRVDAEHECFVLDVSKEKLENAPGFDKDNWPNFADPTFAQTVTSHYRR